MSITLVLGLALALLSGNAQEERIRERGALKGAVRTVSAERARLAHTTEPIEPERLKIEVIAFDKKGRPTERSIYSDYGFFVGRETYAYDAKGTLSKVSVYHADSSLIETRIYSHAPNGKTIRIKTIDRKGRMSLNQNYKYDSQAKPVEEIVRNSRGVVGKTIAKFDSMGNTTEVTHYDRRGLLQEKWRYGYDGAGENPTWEALYRADGSLRRKFVHRYELDPQGNWIKRTSSVQSSSPMGPLPDSTFVTYRKITYY